jgi:hypothetical protein
MVTQPQEALNLSVTEGVLVGTLLHATVYMFLHNLLNVLVQIANKMEIKKIVTHKRNNTGTVTTVERNCDFCWVRLNTEHRSGRPNGKRKPKRANDERIQYTRMLNADVQSKFSVQLNVFYVSGEYVLTRVIFKSKCWQQFRHKKWGLLCTLVELSYRNVYYSDHPINIRLSRKIYNPQQRAW